MVGRQPQCRCRSIQEPMFAYRVELQYASLSLHADVPQKSARPSLHHYRHRSLCRRFAHVSLCCHIQSGHTFPLTLLSQCQPDCAALATCRAVFAARTPCVRIVFAPKADAHQVKLDHTKHSSFDVRELHCEGCILYHVRAVGRLQNDDQAIHGSHARRAIEARYSTTALPRTGLRRNPVLSNNIQARSAWTFQDETPHCANTALRVRFHAVDCRVAKRQFGRAQAWPRGCSALRITVVPELVCTAPETKRRLCS